MFGSPDIRASLTHDSSSEISRFRSTTLDGDLAVVDELDEV